MAGGAEAGGAAGTSTCWRCSGSGGLNLRSRLVESTGSILSVGCSSKRTALPLAFTSKTLKGPRYRGMNLVGEESDRSFVLSRA
eukprot:2747546-Rhodomonas_salina.2